MAVSTADPSQILNHVASLVEQRRFQEALNTIEDFPGFSCSWKLWYCGNVYQAAAEKLEESFPLGRHPRDDLRIQAESLWRKAFAKYNGLWWSTTPDSDRVRQAVNRALYEAIDKSERGIRNNKPRAELEEEEINDFEDFDEVKYKRKVEECDDMECDSIADDVKRRRT